MHIGFNMWFLMNIGPLVEELFGSARFWFIYVFTGIGGYVLSSAVSLRPSVGGSGALLGLVGVMLAVTQGKQSAGMSMLRQQIIRSLIYIAVFGILAWGVVDNYAHIGGLATGYLLGRLMMDRPPMSPKERTRAYLLGWSVALIVALSFAMTVYANLHAGANGS